MSREPATLQKTSWQRPHKLRWDRTGVCNALLRKEGGSGFFFLDISLMIVYGLKAVFSGEKQTTGRGQLPYPEVL